MSKRQTSWPWNVPLAVADIPAEGQPQHLAADAQARAAIARLAGLPEISRLEADVEAIPHGKDGIRVTGRVSATVTQTCVVTLEPMQSEIDEAIDVLYLRNLQQGSGPDRGHSEEELGKIGDERIEPLLGDAIDLGAVATEFLILGIDPYPRRADAEFAPPAPEQPSDGPFAALAALKKSQNHSGE
jgi:uncharacterized metal-binding protein YceD (DUF177 family)